MIRQIEFTLRPRSRGFHPITDEIEANLPPLPAAGLLHLFIKHTSAGLTLNENADPDVRTDLEAIFDRLVREREAYYIHTCEGDDDMPAHAKSTLVGTALTLPVSRGRINLGTWQGIYLCEFRNRAAGRRIVATAKRSVPPKRSRIIAFITVTLCYPRETPSGPSASGMRESVKQRQPS